MSYDPRHYKSHAEAIDAACRTVDKLKAQVATLEATYAAISPETIEKWKTGEMTAGELISFGHETGLLARARVLEHENGKLSAQVEAAIKWAEGPNCSKAQQVDLLRAIADAKP